jgi:hypothetical protein
MASLHAFLSRPEVVRALESHSTASGDAGTTVTADISVPAIAAAGKATVVKVERKAASRWDEGMGLGPGAKDSAVLIAADQAQEEEKKKKKKEQQRQEQEQEQQEVQDEQEEQEQQEQEQEVELQRPAAPPVTPSAAETALSPTTQPPAAVADDGADAGGVNASADADVPSTPSNKEAKLPPL